MKKILFLITMIFSGLIGISQCPCETKAEFDKTDIRPMSKLESGITADFMITIENTGSCGWDKDKVWIEISVKARPKESDQSTVNKAFKTSVKHYIISDSFLPTGETALYKFSVDPPQIGGRYQITVKFFASGQKIAEADSAAIDWK